MPIVAANVTMGVNPLNVACPPPGGIFTVTVRVTVRAAGIGGSYDVSVYDQDVIRDDLLATSVANGVGAGLTRRTHTFFLKCDNNCFVDGPAGNSGENAPTIYAYVDGGGGVTATSGKRTIRCASGPAERRAQRQAKPKPKPKRKSRRR